MDDLNKMRFCILGLTTDLSISFNNGLEAAMMY
jgi:hypothetical protein